MTRSSLLFIPLFAMSCAAVTLTTGCASTATQSSIGETLDDSVITTKIKAAFVEDKSVDALNIAVETFKGTVKLSGFANNATEINRALELTWAVKGVKSVKNDIRLKNGG